MSNEYTCTCTIRKRNYRIAPNFRGTKFSRISLLQIFVEINFADQGFPLAMPSLVGCLINYLLIVAAMPCLAAHFTLLVELCLGPYCGDNHGRQLSRQVKFEVTQYHDIISQFL